MSTASIGMGAFRSLILSAASKKMLNRSTPKSSVAEAAVMYLQKRAPSFTHLQE